MTANRFIICITLVFSATYTSSSLRLWPATADKNLLLLDTDAGGDDAVAIITAVETERLYNGPKIIGITCVNGNAGVDRVAINVLKTLNVVNRLDIPVYKGASHPLILPNKRDNFFGQDGFGDFYYPNPPSTRLIQQQHAVYAMIELVMEYPDQIILVAMGPLTNIALAIRLYPSFLDKLRQLIIMGGSTEGLGNVSPGIEFNFATDPGANRVVLSSSMSKPAILVPWETVRRTPVTTKFRTSLSKSNNSKVWLIDNSAGTNSLKPGDEYWYCADAVAMAVALTSGSIVTKSGTYYSVAIYEGSTTAGSVMVDYTNITGYPANTKIIQRIDDRVYKEILSRSFDN